MSIEERTDRHGKPRYRARYRGTDNKQRSKTFTTKRDARDWLADQRTAKRDGTWRDPGLAKITFESLVEQWRQQSGHLTPKTVAGYESVLGKWVIPATPKPGQPTLKGRKIGAVRKSDIRKILTYMEHEANASPSTRRNVLNVCRAVFRVAVDDELLVTSPAKGIKIERAPKREQTFLTADEVEAVANAIPEPYDTLVRFAAYTGLRAGEIAALRVGRVDLMRGTIDVRDAFTEVHGAQVLGDTKSHRRRTVGLPRFLCDELAVYLAREGIAADRSAFVFRSPTKVPSRVPDERKPLRQSNFYRRLFKPAVEAADIGKHVRFHDLRHTCVALLIGQGAHPRAVMERMGHSSITVSMDTYGHLFPSLDEALTDGLNDVAEAARAAR